MSKIKDYFKNKNNLIIIIFSFVIFISIFLILKGELYYNNINYFKTYIEYYIDKYLGGNISYLFSDYDSSLLFYVENDLQNTLSAIYIYVLTFSNSLFWLLIIAIPILIFNKIHNEFYDELYNKFSINKIVRIGKRKYIFNTIFKRGVSIGLLLLIPRLLYFLLLYLFMPSGVSYTHVLTSIASLTNAFLFLNYSVNPYLLIAIDLLISFLYGFIITELSLFIISLIRNKPLSYLIFIFSICLLSIIFYVLGHPIIISFISVFTYYSMSNYDIFNIKYILVDIGVITIFMCILNILVLNIQVGKNI